MKTIDVSFSDADITEFKKMIGKKMIKFKCDPFIFSTSVYGIVGISIENAAYAFTNLIETADYFGQKEDVAMFKMEQKPLNEICSMVQGQEMITHPIENVISEISIINEKQQLFKNGVQIYEVLVTRGIIFKFKDNYEFSLEKNIWFSEDISVEKGYNLIERFTPTSEFEESWSGEYRGKCSREIIKIID